MIATSKKNKKDKKPAKPDAMAKYIAEIDRFVEELAQQQVTSRQLENDAACAKLAYEEAKEKLREARELEHGTVSLLLKFVRPGSVNILPLFDTLEEADEEVHGQHAEGWRKLPIVELGLSAAALRALVDADVVLIGQLQDRILAKKDVWNEEIVGINEGMAQAIEAKLAAFIEERSK